MRVEIAGSKPAEERNEKLNLTGRPMPSVSSG